MSNVHQMAKELGETLGRTAEYQALKRAALSVDEDRELVGLRNELDKVESEILLFLQAGTDPDEEVRERYDRLVQDLQLRPGYQRLIVAQANFDKLLKKVNDTTSAAIREGSESRIILP